MTESNSPYSAELFSEKMEGHIRELEGVADKSYPISASVGMIVEEIRENMDLDYLKLTKKEISLSEISRQLEINEYEVMALVRELRLTGINIVTQQRDDDIYMYNHGEKELTDENSYQFYTDEENEFKFVAISDTRFGSKSQQLSILNDIYIKANELGFRNVILCGNITEGLYPLNNIYSESNFLDDTLRQVDYIIKYYPHIDGMKTYFLTGYKDEIHLKKNNERKSPKIQAKVLKFW